MTAPIIISDDLREEIVRRAEDMVAEKKRHLSRMNEANRIDPENQFDILPTLVELTMAQITLRAIQASTVAWQQKERYVGIKGAADSTVVIGLCDYEPGGLKQALIEKIVEVE